MIMETLYPRDFDNNDGRIKIIDFLYELEAEIHQLGRTVHGLASKEADLENDVEDLLRMEGVEYKQY